MSKLDITFDSNDITLAGHLYRPQTEGPHPAIVVGHPGSGVKEQAAGLYARRLSEAGFVTLAYDAAYQGESGGKPRGLEDPAQRVEDLKAAVSYLSAQSFVTEINALGICASGGYALAATATDHRIQRIATVSSTDIARVFRYGADGTQDPAVFDGMLDQAAAARAGGPQDLVLFPETIEQARALGGEHGAEGFEYYRTPRAEHPRSAQTFPWISIDRMATFDAFAAVPLIGSRPLLMVAGTRAVTAWMGIEAYQRARGPKEFHWVEGASHVDLYDKPEYVVPVIAKLAAFFRTPK
ncbi:alpha/beta hydrolase [Kribbella sp. NPDC058245]|uniref:alpha/beta hydrolase n=1 Tax=Kribbella sp. NPDC058245 TaxID=3346399 RepID=UPI0036EAF2FF